jgi:hypothetical protein
MKVETLVEEARAKLLSIDADLVAEGIRQDELEPWTRYEAKEHVQELIDLKGNNNEMFLSIIREEESYANQLLLYPISNENYPDDDNLCAADFLGWALVELILDEIFGEED